METNVILGIKNGNDCNQEDGLVLRLTEDEPGFYRSIILPMLRPGREAELLTWLRDNNLLPRTNSCRNKTKQPQILNYPDNRIPAEMAPDAVDNNCNYPMQWLPSRVVDKYQWQCIKCAAKKRIRDDSFFKDFKGPLSNCIRVCFAWTKNIPIEDVADGIGVKLSIVKSIYKKCSQVAKTYIKFNKEEWRIGGPGVVVVVDHFPYNRPNYTNEVRSSRNNNNTPPILCIAECRDIPTKIWYQALNTNDPVAETLQVVKDIIRPGSIVIVDPTINPIISCTNFEELGIYSKILYMADLRRHDNECVTMLQILETIWEPALDVCEEAQTFSLIDMQAYLCSQMWMHRFGRKQATAFQTLFAQIVDYSNI